MHTRTTYGCTRVHTKTRIWRERAGGCVAGRAEGTELLTLLLNPAESSLTAEFNASPVDPPCNWQPLRSRNVASFHDRPFDSASRDKEGCLPRVHGVSWRTLTSLARTIERTAEVIFIVFRAIFRGKAKWNWNLLQWFSHSIFFFFFVLFCSRIFSVYRSETYVWKFRDLPVEEESFSNDSRALWVTF